MPCGANDLFHPDPDFTAIERALRRVLELAAATLACGYGAVLVDMWDHPVTPRPNLPS